MLRFTVPNMACGGCVKGVTRAIQSVDADALVETDTAQREVRVESAKAGEAALLARSRAPATQPSAGSSRLADRRSGRIRWRQSQCSDDANLQRVRVIGSGR